MKEGMKRKRAKEFAEDMERKVENGDIIVEQFCRTIEQLQKEAEQHPRADNLRWYQRGVSQG
jgi:hypothetical protein